MKNTLIHDEISFLYHSAYLCREEKSGYDGAWQIAPFQCSIPYEDGCLDHLFDLKQRLNTIFPELIAFGENRAKKAFVDRSDTITKPSYVSRIRNYLGSGTDQCERMAKIASREPASGGLVFSIFSPEDLIKRRRPGYVPCLISGSFLLHKNELHLNAFFRSQSVVEFGIFDLIFLRKFQNEFLSLYNRESSNNRKAKAGPLSLHFGRIIVQRRFMKGKMGFVRRDQIFDKWINEIEGFMLEGRWM